MDETSSVADKQTCPRRDGGYGHGVKDADTWGPDKTCSFCGSLHPDEALRLIDEGSKVGPTDKNYKMYIDGTRKAYFQHFGEEHKTKLIDLCNEKKVVFEYPGYFYRLPFFMKRIEAEESAR